MCCVPIRRELIYDLYKDRVVFSKDFCEFGKVYFEDSIHYDKEFIEKKFKLEQIPALNAVTNIIFELSNWNVTEIEMALKDFLKTGAIKPGELFPALRVAISGIPMGPEVHKMIQLLGQTKFKKKIGQLITFVESKTKGV